jgi:hypothetical protein
MGLWTKIGVLRAGGNPMKLRLLAVSAAAFGLMAASAQAAIVVDHKVGNQLFTLDSGGMLDNFDSIQRPSVSYSGLTIAPINFEDPISTSAPPPYEGVNPAPATTHSGATPLHVDPTTYASVQGQQSATFTMLSGYLTSFSFYMGSPDPYNHMVFHLLGGGSQSLDGDAIWGGSPNADGDRSTGFRVYYNFNGARVTSIDFSSDTNAFEYDGLAGQVPEPAAWSLMIAGFGGMGALLRRRRRTAAVS